MARNPDYEQAVEDNAVSMVREFLRQGESPDDYVCFLAIRYNANAVLRVLINAGGDLNAVEHPKCSGYTPLARAIAAKNMQAFRLLLKAGALINKQGYFESPLHVAAKEGSVAFTRACIAAGATIDLPEKVIGQTPLMSAAVFGHVNIVKLLLKAGANPRKRDKYGRTARKIAADLDQSEVVKSLTEWSVPKKKR
jgi:ankyrin repeat protein